MPNATAKAQNKAPQSVRRLVTLAAFEHEFPQSFRRQDEERLVDLCVSGNTDPSAWRQCGSGFFMGGLAVLLASSRHFDREKYLDLADALQVGMSTNLRLVQLWLDKSPVRPSRFMNMVKTRKRLGIA
jgi:hypothetical protein